jgi:hypothetical protein
MSETRRQAYGALRGVPSPFDSHSLSRRDVAAARTCERARSIHRVRSSLGLYRVANLSLTRTQSRTTKRASRSRQFVHRWRHGDGDRGRAGMKVEALTTMAIGTQVSRHVSDGILGHRAYVVTTVEAFVRQVSVLGAYLELPKQELYEECRGFFTNNLACEIHWRELCQ